MDRKRKIKKFGLEIVLADEEYWLKLGYIIDPKTGLLLQTDSQSK